MSVQVEPDPREPLPFGTFPVHHKEKVPWIGNQEPEEEKNSSLSGESFETLGPVLYYCGTDCPS